MECEHSSRSWRPDRRTLFCTSCWEHLGPPPYRTICTLNTVLMRALSGEHRAFTWKTSKESYQEAWEGGVPLPERLVEELRALGVGAWDDPDAVQTPPPAPETDWSYEILARLPDGTSVVQDSTGQVRRCFPIDRPAREWFHAGVLLPEGTDLDAYLARAGTTPHAQELS